MSLDLDEEPDPRGANGASVSFQELRGKRWIHGGYQLEDVVPLAEDVAAVHNGTHIKILYLKSGTYVRTEYRRQLAWLYLNSLIFLFFFLYQGSRGFICRRESAVSGVSGAGTTSRSWPGVILSLIHI